MNPIWLALPLLVGMVVPLALHWAEWSRGRRVAGVALALAAYPMALGRLLELAWGSVYTGPPVLEGSQVPLLAAFALAGLVLPLAVAMVRWRPAMAWVLLVPSAFAMLIWASRSPIEAMAPYDVGRAASAAGVLLGALALPWALPSMWPPRGALPIVQFAVVALAAIPLVVPGPGYAIDGLWTAPRLATHELSIQIDAAPSEQYAFSLRLDWDDRSPWASLDLDHMQPWLEVDGDAQLASQHGFVLGVQGRGPAMLNLSISFYASTEVQESHLESDKILMEAASGAAVAVTVREVVAAPWCHFTGVWIGTAGIDDHLGRVEGLGQCS